MIFIDEIWREVSGYEGFYEVSNYGRVRSLDHECGHRWGGKALRRGRILRPGMTNVGYPLVYLSRESVVRPKTIHRLVARAFIPNPDGLPEVNHRDLNKTNNHVSNLEWCSRRQNYNHARDRGRCGGTANPKCAKKLTAESVAEMRQRFDCGERVSDLAVRFGVSKSTVSVITRRLAWV